MENQNIPLKRQYEELFINNLTKKHALYKQTTELAKDYKSWMTGVGLDSFVRSYDKRETPTEKTARLKITKHLLPRVSQNVRDSYMKALRNNNVNIDVDTESLGEEEKKSFDNARALFFQFDTVEEYWMNRYKELQFLDPNAWLVVDFYNTDEGVKPYLREVASENVITYKYINGKLKYLIFKEGQDYYLYSLDFVMKASRTEVRTQETVKIDDFGKILSSSRVIQNYIVQSSMYDYNEAFAMQVGYIRSSVNPEMFVSPLEKARPDIERLVSQVSEYDINTIIHVFMQKFEYAGKCAYHGCVGGTLADGAICPNCKGTGLQPNHESGIDTVQLPIPRDVADMMELSKLVHYVQLPIDIVKHQKEEIMYSIDEIEKTAMNSDIFTRSEISATATEKNIELQNVYDILYPFAVKYCQTYQFILEKMADLFGFNEKVKVSYYVDRDMKLKTVVEQMNEIGTAITNNIPSFILNSMIDKLAKTELRNDPEGLKQYETKKLFNITSGLTAQEKSMLIAGLPTDSEIRIMVLMFEHIFVLAEMENKDFYSLEYAAQKTIIDSIVLELKEKMKAPITRYDIADE